MTGRQPPSRASSFASRDTTASNRNAALAGAALAFGRPQVKPLPRDNTGRGNGALAAAARVGSTPSPKSGNTTSSPSQGGLVQRTPTRVRPQSPHCMGANSIPSLQPPQRDPRERSKSPSQHAAAIAASRSPVSMKPAMGPGNAAAVASSSTAGARPKPTPRPKPRRLSTSSTISQGPDAQALDMEHVQPTRSLVQMFERKSNNSTPVGGREARSISPVRPTSAKPGKAGTGITSMFQLELEETKSRSRSRGRPITPSKRLPQSDGFSSDDEATYASAAEQMTPKKPPTPVSKRWPVASQRPPMYEARARSSILQRQDSSLSPTRRAPSAAISIPLQQARPQSLRAPSPPRSRSLAASYRQLHPTRRSPITTSEDLANAMVASSLASSRAPSPHKHAPPPVPARRHHKLHRDQSRNPSPAKKGMRQTLRATASSSSDSDSDEDAHPYGKHRKKRHLRKHPNKHAEGDRKRWRDAVTERERKRYEGVWAANRGIHCTLSLSEQQQAHYHPQSETVSLTDRPPKLPNLPEEISNLVARDLYQRSRLPVQTLEAIWNLVDTRRVGRLEKEEFVVGLWLIDQRLKGRKLPTRVSETVWASVRALAGVKVRK